MIKLKALQKTIDRAPVVDIDTLTMEASEIANANREST